MRKSGRGDTPGRQHRPKTRVFSVCWGLGCKLHPSLPAGVPEPAPTPPVNSWILLSDEFVWCILPAWLESRQTPRFYDASACQLAFKGHPGDMQNAPPNRKHHPKARNAP